MRLLDKSRDLLTLLASRKQGATRKDLERRWNCSAVTVYRTIERIKNQFSIPIRFDSKRSAYYCDSEKALETPGLWFHPDELASLLGLSQWLENLGSGVFHERLAPIRSRLEKMLREQDVDPSIWNDRIRLLPMGSRALNPDNLLLASQAVLKRKLLVFAYKGIHDSRFQAREVSPQSLVRYRDNWFLDAYCHSNRGLRSFSLSRMRDVQLRDTSTKEISRDELDKHFADAYGIFGGKSKSKAILVFKGLAARLVENEQWHPRQTVRYLVGGRIRLEFPCGDLRELTRDVMRYADEVQVLSPLELRKSMDGMLQRATQNHAPIAIPRKRMKIRKNPDHKMIKVAS